MSLYNSSSLVLPDLEEGGFSLVCNQVSFLPDLPTALASKFYAFYIFHLWLSTYLTILHTYFVVPAVYICIQLLTCFPREQYGSLGDCRFVHSITFLNHMSLINVSNFSY